MFIPDKAHKQNLPPYQHKVRAPIWNISHIIQSSPLWSYEKRPVQNTQSASCSSSSVRSSAKGTARSVSECYGVSDGVGSQQTLLFRLFEGPRRAFDASQMVLDLVACFILFFWVVRWTCFLCCSTTRIWLQVQAWHRADIWWSESPSRSERQKISRSEWWLIAGFTKGGCFTGAAFLSSEDRGKSYGLKMFLLQGKQPVPGSH